MTVSIYDLTRIPAPTGGEIIPAYSSSLGGNGAMVLSAILSYIQDNLSIGQHQQQYAAPSATGFSVSLTEIEGRDIWLVLTPVAGYAAGTIVLPATAYCQNGQEILVNCTQSVSTLTITGSGSTVTGAPTSLSANEFFTLKYEAVTTTWYRVG